MRKARIGSVAVVIMGQSPAGSSCNRVGLGVPLLNGPTEFGLFSPVPAQWTTEPRKFAEPGDVLLCVRGSTTGRMNRADRRYALGRGVCAIRASGHDRDNRFIEHALRFQLGNLLALTTGSVFPNLSRKDIEGFEIPWPSQSERYAIADLLGALDDKIAVNERIAGTAESLSLAWASEDLWDVRIPLGDLVEHVKEQVAPTSIQAARVAHYSLPAFDQGRLPEITDPEKIKSAKFSVSGAVVLLSKLNPATPRVWNVEPDPGLPALASTEFLVLRPKVDIHPAELWAVCNQPGFRDDVANKATGTSNSHQRAKPADILASHVVDPRSMRTSSREQIVSLCARAKLARIESQKLADLRDALLPGLMSGAIRVRDAEKAVEEAT